MMTEDFKSKIFEQVEIYLKEIGEFAPFGGKIKSGVFKEVLLYDEGDDEGDVNSLKMMSILKDDLSNQLIDNQIDQAVIVANTSISIKGVRTDAVLIICSFDGEIWKEDYYPYFFDNDELKWGVK